MNNRKIFIQSEGKKAFDLAFQLIFDNAPGGKATHYLDHPEKGFILLWHEDIGALKLPFPMGWEDSANMAWGWLQNQPDKAYKDFCDHDGDNEKGFRVYNEDWGHVANSHYAFAAVLPIWAWYGK